jgi:hypothetical protein
LSWGDTGAEVKTLQNRLLELGYLSGKANGTFDRATVQAVQAYQKQTERKETAGRRYYFLFEQEYGNGLHARWYRYDVRLLQRNPDYLRREHFQNGSTEDVFFFE